MNKKIVYIVLLTMIFAMSLASCGGHPETVADVSEAPASEQTAAPTEAPDPIISSGTYNCYDRFSGEAVSGFYLEVTSATDSQVVFTYSTSAGTHSGLTVTPDSSGAASINLTDTLSLNMTFYDSEIHVDEIEGMGAMAYVFR